MTSDNDVTCMRGADWSLGDDVIARSLGGAHAQKVRVENRGAVGHK